MPRLKEEDWEREESSQHSQIVQQHTVQVNTGYTYVHTTKFVRYVHKNIQHNTHIRTYVHPCTHTVKFTHVNICVRESVKCAKLIFLEWCVK